MPGAVELGEEIFHSPVRRGVPQGVRGFEELLRSPVYATAVGLLRYGLQQMEEEHERDVKGRFSGLWRWFRGMF